MVNPVLTLLVAGSVQLWAETPRQAELARIVVEITQAVELPRVPAPLAERELTVCDVPYYYDAFLPAAAPEAAPLITYDWRSPVFFDVP
jgi:hypothetical protein